MKTISWTATPSWTAATTPAATAAREIGEALVDLRVPFLAVDQDRPHPERTRALDILLERVADHHRVRGFDVEPAERRLEDRRVWLDAAVRARVHDRIDVEAVMRDELSQVADPVRDETDA